MRDLAILIIAEQKTLLRGLLLSFFVVLPFTFLPAIGKYGFSFQSMSRQLPDSIFYALCLALVVVIAAVSQNYNSLVERKRLFDKPAFTRLDFYGRLDGVGSIVKELETFLLGKVGDYYFRLNLVKTDQEKFSIEIVPLIDLSADTGLIARLIQEYGFKKNYFFGLTIGCEEEDLEEEDFLLEKLTTLAATLAALQAKQLDIGSINLHD